MQIDDAISAVDQAIREINFVHEIDFCVMMIDFIETVSEGDSSSLIKHIAESFRKADCAGKKDLDEIIGQAEFKRLKSAYGPIVNGLIDLSLKDNPSEVLFYTKVSQAILNPIFEGKNAKAFCLYYHLVDKRLPYFQLIENPLRMGDDEYEEAQKRLFSSIEKVRHILARDFPQKTMEADNLLTVIEGAQERGDRVLLLTAVVARLRSEYELLKRAVAEARR